MSAVQASNGVMRLSWALVDRVGTGITTAASRAGGAAEPRRQTASRPSAVGRDGRSGNRAASDAAARSEEHTSELQSRLHLVCRLLLEKKKKKSIATRSEMLRL